MRAYRQTLPRRFAPHSPKQYTISEILAAVSLPTPRAENTDFPVLHDWLTAHAPEMEWGWDWVRFAHSQLDRVTRGEIDRIAFAVPPQHGKTRSITVPYPAWRMLRTPGLRAGIGAHTQQYANKISRWVRKLVLAAGGVVGDVNRENEWSLANGSTFVAKGVGAALAGEPFDLFMMDDVFGAREDADSLTTQERIYEWYMDDVTPRLQKDAALVLCNTRWGPGDLFGRVKDSEEAGEWVFVRIPAISEEQNERDAVNATYGLPAGQLDPIGRTASGLPLCEQRFPLAKLLQKKRTAGVGFESLFQGNPIPRGGTFFERSWFGQPVHELPEGCELVRYWDLAASRNDSACYTSGVLMARHGQGEARRFFIVDVIRGRWMPAERNEVMLQTARADKERPGFRRTWFEEPVFDRDRAAARAITAKLAGYPVSPDKVSGAGSKELRAEPLAGAAKAGLVRLVAGGWNGALLTEYEGFPRGQYKDQVDSGSGAFNKLATSEIVFLGL